MMWLLALLLSSRPTDAPHTERQPFVFTVDHPVGVEASSMARCIKMSCIATPVSYRDGGQAIKGAVISVERTGGTAKVVLTSNGSPDHLTAYIADNVLLKAGVVIGISCLDVAGDAVSAQVSRCTLVSAPGMPASTLVFKVID